MTIPVCGIFMCIGWLASKGYGSEKDGLMAFGLVAFWPNGLKLSKQSGPI